MDFRLLGPLEVLADGRALPVGDGRQRALLALLLLRANQVVPSERLVEELWDGRSAPTAPKMLQKYVWQLRTALGDREPGVDVQRLQTRGAGYLLRVGPDELDADRFERLLREGRAARAAGQRGAAETLRAALGIAPDAVVGDEVHTSLGAAGSLDGVIDYSTPEFLGLRTDDGLWRFFGRNFYNGVVGMSAHVFVDGVDAAKSEAALKAWLDGVYA